MAVLGTGMFISGCAKRQTAMWESLKNPETVKQLKQFVVEKHMNDAADFAFREAFAFGIMHLTSFSSNPPVLA